MTGSQLLDVVLVLALVGYSLIGLRQGLVVSAASVSGFLAGGALAMWALPSVLARWHAMDRSPMLRSTLIVIAVLLVASLGQGVGSALGRAVSARVRAPAVRAVDAALGALASLLATALLVWFVAGAVRGGTIEPLSRAIGQSRVIAAIDDVVPPRAGDLFSEFGRSLESRGFPRVFGGVQAEPIAPVEAPATGIAADPEVRAAARSVVRIEGQAPACGANITGSGWVLAPGRVVTNAHVVAGTSRLTVRSGGRSYAARPVLVDPRRDVAVLSVRDLDAPALRLGPDLARGEQAAALGYPGGGPYTVSGARVRDRLDARGTDIYGRTAPSRDIYSLRVVVRPGSSGGPLVDLDGRVTGVIFATSLDDPQTGYALTLDEVRPLLRVGETASAAVPPGACVRD